MSNSEVRSPAVAGLFYPSDPEEIRQQLHEFLDGAEPALQSDRPVRGIIAPHAGYPYSGAVAAYAYKAIADLQPARIIILGPSHRLHFQGVSIYNGSAFNTPLGAVSIDRQYAQELREYPGVSIEKAGHKDEHSIEVQLPFLQVVYSHQYQIVPIALGSQDPDTIRTLADALIRTWDAGSLVIASTDLSHFYDYDKALLMDTTFSELLESGDIDGLWDAMNDHRIEACGFGGVLTILRMLSLWDETDIQILKMANSADAGGDRNRVVGYLSAVVQGK